MTLGSQSGRVIGVEDPADLNYPGNGYKTLIIEGDSYGSNAGAGQWYRIKGNCTTEEIARCGTWASAASCTGGQTTFVVESWAELREEQLGWFIQPDINCQAWFPITGINEYNHTVTVAGDHANLGTQGTRFTCLATVR